MNHSQDIPARVIYVFRPRPALLQHLQKQGLGHIAEAMDELTVLMTKELPFEQHLEGWRRQILESCVEEFLNTLCGECYPFETQDQLEQALGSLKKPLDLFHQWWIYESADDYIEIATNWTERA